MAGIETPDLDANPVFLQLMGQVEQIIGLEGCATGFINWQGIINTAMRLRGQDLLMDLYDKPDVCHRLFDAISTTMIDGLQRLQRRQRDSGADYNFVTVSNCSVNMVSPEQYEEFLLPYDRRMAEAFGTIGIHNCAWSADPYLELYSAIPGLAYIDMGLHSDFARARCLIPHARRSVMYTPMDLANKTEQAIRADFERIARDYAPCDIVLADIEVGTPDERVRFVVELCCELSASAEKVSA